MRTSVKILLGLGWFFIIGTPLILTIAALAQAPEGHTGIGANLTKIIVGNFAALPFMFLGLILVIVGVVKNRNRTNT